MYSNIMMLSQKGLKFFQSRRQNIEFRPLLENAKEELSLRTTEWLGCQKVSKRHTCARRFEFGAHDVTSRDQRRRLHNARNTLVRHQKM